VNALLDAHFFPIDRFVQELNAAVESNMYSMSVTLLTSQADMSPLNAAASRKISFMVVTLLVSQVCSSIHTSTDTYYNEGFERFREFSSKPNSAYLLLIVSDTYMRSAAN